MRISVDRLELDDADVLRASPFFPCEEPGTSTGAPSCEGGIGALAICGSNRMLANGCVPPGCANPAGTDCADALGNDSNAPAFTTVREQCRRPTHELLWPGHTATVYS